MGAEVKEINFNLDFTSEDEQFVDQFLNNKGINHSQRLLAINCSTFRPSRNWPYQFYAQLANQLYQQAKAKIVFLGVDKDKDAFMQIKKQLNFAPLDFIGAFTVRQLGVFLKKCALLISPDSGTMHIANALGTPLVVLFGPGEYERYRPYNKMNTIIINKNVECAPCFKLHCSKKKCMELIRPEEVLAAAKQLLTNS
jgi:heptosyltransferase-2